MANRSRPVPRRSSARPAWQSTLLLCIGSIMVAACVAWWWTKRIQSRQGIPPDGTAPAEVTFTKDIAPMVFQHCSPCHRPGQAAPFSLLTYGDLKKHGKQIVEVTATGYMPPWLAEPGYGDFANIRRLTPGELELIRRWVAEGYREGRRADLPPAPHWADDWMIGKPDLVVSLAQPFHLPPSGRDVFRNFVFPVPVSTGKYVRAVELYPQNRKVLHHALIKLDRTREARQLDEQDPEPGFTAMRTGAEMPGGHFLTWQPGRVAAPLPEGLSWRLEPGSDLVLEAHLNPSGKPELFQPSIGLYFTERPPTNTIFKMALTSLLIDIPPGTTNYLVTNSFTIPADVDLLAVMPHAHYLGRDVQAWATLPDGRKEWLIWIKHWDFNWQSDYRYKRSVYLPRGTTLQVEFRFDNSAANERNPNQPPRRVRYGLQSQDEMAELWLQLLPRHESDRPLLARAYDQHVDRIFCTAAEYALGLDSNDFKAHLDLGIHLPPQGRDVEGMEHLLLASRLQPENDLPHYYMGVLRRRQNQLQQAREEFEAALRLNPRNVRALGNLGFISEEQGQLQEAAERYRAALALNPYDELVQRSLQELRQRLGQERPETKP